MLNTMRRHAGWGVKVILGAVIVTFVFFFGYNQIQKAAQNVAIKVNGKEVTFAQYNYFYDQEYERFRQAFQGESGQLPEFILNSIKMQTQRRLTQRILFADLGRELGFTIPDSKLANWIANNVKTGDNTFDPLAYKNYLSYFQTKNQFSYENLLHEDLLIQQAQSWLDKISIPEEVLLEQNKEINSQTWNFEKITVDSEETANNILRRGNILTSDKGNVEKKEGITLSNREQLASAGQLTFEDWVQVFDLTSKEPFLKKVIPSNGKFVLIRFVKKEKSKKEEATNTPSLANFTNDWFNAYTQKAEVKIYIPNEQ